MATNKTTNMFKGLTAEQLEAVIAGAQEAKKTAPATVAKTGPLLPIGGTEKKATQAGPAGTLVNLGIGRGVALYQNQFINYLALADQNVAFLAAKTDELPCGKDEAAEALCRPQVKRVLASERFRKAVAELSAAVVEAAKG